MEPSAFPSIARDPWAARHGEVLDDCYIHLFKRRVNELLLFWPACVKANDPNYHYQEMRMRWIDWLARRLNNRYTKLRSDTNTLLALLDHWRRIWAQAQVVSQFVQEYKEKPVDLFPGVGGPSYFVHKIYAETKRLHEVCSDGEEELDCLQNSIRQLEALKALSLGCRSSESYGRAEALFDLFRLDLMIFVAFDENISEEIKFDILEHGVEKQISDMKAGGLLSSNDEERLNKWKEQMLASKALAKCFSEIRKDDSCYQKYLDKMEKLMDKLEWSDCKSTTTLDKLFMASEQFKSQQQQQQQQQQQNSGLMKSSDDESRDNETIEDEYYFETSINHLKGRVARYYRRVQLKLLAVLEPMGISSKVSAPQQDRRPMDLSASSLSRIPRGKPNFNPFICEKEARNHSYCNCDDCCEDATYQSRLDDRLKTQKTHNRMLTLMFDTHPTIVAHCIVTRMFPGDWSRAKVLLPHTRTALSMGNLICNGVAAEKDPLLAPPYCKPQVYTSPLRDDLARATSLARLAINDFTISEVNEAAYSISLMTSNSAASNTSKSAAASTSKSAASITSNADATRPSVIGTSGSSATASTSLSCETCKTDERCAKCENVLYLSYLSASIQRRHRMNSGVIELQVKSDSLEKKGVRVSEPVRATKPIEVTEPGKATKPLRTADPDRAMEPARAVESPKVSEPVRITEPVTATQPDMATEPLRNTEPVRATKPASITEPNRGTEPARDTEPIRATEAVRVTEPVMATEAVRDSEPVRTTERVRTTEPVWATGPVRATEPIRTTEPARAIEPVITTEPVVTSSNPSTIVEKLPAKQSTAVEQSPRVEQPTATKRSTAEQSTRAQESAGRDQSSETTQSEEPAAPIKDDIDSTTGNKQASTKSKSDDEKNYNPGNEKEVPSEVVRDLSMSNHHALTSSTNYAEENYNSVTQERAAPNNSENIAFANNEDNLASKSGNEGTDVSISEERDGTSDAEDDQPPKDTETYCEVSQGELSAVDVETDSVASQRDLSAVDDDGDHSVASDIGNDDKQHLTCDEDYYLADNEEQDGPSEGFSNSNGSDEDISSTSDYVMVDEQPLTPGFKTVSIGSYEDNSLSEINEVVNDPIDTEKQVVAMDDEPTAAVAKNVNSSIMVGKASSIDECEKETLVEYIETSSAGEDSEKGMPCPRQDRTSAEICKDAGKKEVGNMNKIDEKDADSSGDWNVI